MALNSALKDRFSSRMCLPRMNAVAGPRVAQGTDRGWPKGEERTNGDAYRLLQFELRHLALVSLLAHHVQKFIRAFALGLDTETL